MREIKFRAWDMGRQCWFLDGFSVCESGEEIFDTDEQAYLRGEKVELQQFTGHHDKNSKEIYEGDILSTVVAGINEPFVVSWDRKGARFKCDNGGFVIDAEVWSEREVIGNVYETPDLLEPKNG